MVILAGGVLLLSTVTAVAEPAWTRTGDCKSCHTDVLPSVSLAIVNSDGRADPDGPGPLPEQKVFQMTRGQARRDLAVQVMNLDAGDGYAIELLGLSRPGVRSSSRLLYSADCDWAEWPNGQSRFYSNPVRSAAWGTGPTLLSYSIGIDAEASYDYYDLLFALVGVKAATGERFYQEEHFYIAVPPANWSPAVTIVRPAANSEFVTPVDVTVEANASDLDGTVTKVEFFAGTTLLGEATKAPYRVVWSQVPAGDYALSARATDNLGAVTTSPTVHIVVRVPAPVPGDFDHDGDVDQADYAHLQLCLAGPGVVVAPSCSDASLDGNSSVDGNDVMVFARCLSGSNIPGNPDCAK